MTVLIVDDQPDVVRGEEQGIDWPKLGIDTILTAYGWTYSSATSKCRPGAA